MVARNNIHFADEEWADFLNGQLSKEQAQKMQGHLDSNCKTCRKAFGVWQLVHATAQRESQYQVPEWALRHVRNAFSMLAKPGNSKRGFQIPRLVFDSFWQPALAGTRSATNAARQLRYKSGDITVELRLEPELNSDRINITGQVSDLNQEDAGLTGVQVLVTGAGGNVVEASTNRFGEFQMSFVQENNLQLSIGMTDGKDFSIPLDLPGSEEAPWN